MQSPPKRSGAEAPLTYGPEGVRLEQVPAPKRFDQSLDDLVRDGVVTPSERNLIRNGGAETSPAQTTTPAKPGAQDPEAIRERMQLYREAQRDLDARKAAEEEARHARTWHPYGDIEIKRSRWVKKGDGTWYTETQKSFSGLRWGSGTDGIAVACKSLMVNRYEFRRWRGWKRPDAGTALEQLVIDRCSSNGTTVPPVR